MIFDRGVCPSLRNILSEEFLALPVCKHVYGMAFIHSNGAVEKTGLFSGDLLQFIMLFRRKDICLSVLRYDFVKFCIRMDENLLLRI